ncbi:MAG: hypothetical protein M1526_05030 [Candidatus Thermoplasmatota archaeon]|jgi:predicted DNA-binding protein|nr:hypothetical protein [Candidatus Thermoplasmatota archaeon]MCL5681334.1 hypothetical protein [Candidatus Thermoplasmatota archaeon]
MARMNISITNEMVQRIQNLSKEDNKTVSSIVTESIGIYEYLKENHLNWKDLERLSDYLRLTKAMNAIPVPSILLDFTIGKCVACSKEETLNSWMDRGKQLGEFIKSMAGTVEDLQEIIKKYSKFLPLDGVDMRIEDGKITFIVNGAGYSKESAMVTSAGIQGFLEVYGYKDFHAEIIEGFVKVTASSTTASGTAVKE